MSETADRAWAWRADWSLRTPGFGELRVHGERAARCVAMEFTPPVPDELWQLWRGLRPSRHILEPLEPPWLRYAAIDWRRAPLGPAELATCGAKLTWIGEFLLRAVAPASLGWLTSPRIWFDLEDEVRVAFVGEELATTDRFAPEVRARFPHCDERGLVFMVGGALRDLGALGLGARELVRPTSLVEVIARCTASDPAQRFGTLAELRDALRLAGGARVLAPRLRKSRAAWTELEHGIGWLALDRPTEALLRFEAALALDPKSARARAQQREAIARGSDVAVALPRRVRRELAWRDVAARGLALEQAHDHAAALELYRRIDASLSMPIELALALARCHLRLGFPASALEPTDYVLREQPAHSAALALRFEALHRIGNREGALALAQAWVAAIPDEGAAHHAHGRSLLVLRRPAEARDAFDRASLLSPALIEAMLLRREADRMLLGVRASVGAAAAMAVAIPPHLAALRDVLATGSSSDGIRMLAQSEHAADPEAQLLRASLLVFDGHTADALAIFETVAGHAAQLGKARALLALGRAADALALFDQVAAERPDLHDAFDGRARALKQLGRDAEAEAAFRHYLTLLARGSDLRVRAAQH